MQLDDMTWRPGVRFAVWWGLVAGAISIVISFFGYQWARAFGFFVAFIAMTIAANEWRVVASQVAEMMFNVLHSPVTVCSRCTTRRGRVMMQAGETIPAGSAVVIGDDGLARCARGQDG